MDAHSDPSPVVDHWPFVRRHLRLAATPALARALDTLAKSQLLSSYDPVPMSRSHNAEMTAGETGRMRQQLYRLEARRVVVRYRGAGRRPDAWSFHGDVSHWRGMPWESSGAAVDRPIWACICRAGLAVAARIPGQGSPLPRGGAEFHLSDADHAWRHRESPAQSGALPVENYGYGEGRAATANCFSKVPGQGGCAPVDTRGNGESGAPLVLLPEEYLRTPRLLEEDERRFKQLEDLTGHLWGAPEKSVRALAASLTDEAVAELVRLYRSSPNVPKAVPERARYVAALGRAPAVRARAALAAPDAQAPCTVSTWQSSGSTV